jgi:hypothetical protein
LVSGADLDVCGREPANVAIRAAGAGRATFCSLWA